MKDTLDHRKRGAMENLEEFQIPKDAIEKLQDPEFLRKQVEEGKTFQEILGYNLETMEKFYTAACNLFQKQEYRQAADAFIFLSTLNPFVPTYWLGLGMSQQLDEEYRTALLAYGMAILTDVQNPLPHYHSGFCYRMLGEYENAKTSLDLAITTCNDFQEYGWLKQRSQIARHALEKSH
jgi:type III secretion system low calcium response chaperone LcrH/SycD